MFNFRSWKVPKKLDLIHWHWLNFGSIDSIKMGVCNLWDGLQITDSDSKIFVEKVVTYVPCRNISNVEM